jgi:hypothetical protein
VSKKKKKSVQPIATHVYHLINLAAVFFNNLNNIFNLGIVAYLQLAQ